MAAVGLLPADADRDLPPQFVSTGLATLIAPSRAGRAIARAAPDFDLIELCWPSVGPNLYLVWLDGDAKARGADVHGMRAGRGGPRHRLRRGAAVRVSRGARRGGTRVEITQGVEMGRPSRLLAEMEGDRLRVSGEVVQVIEGRCRCDAAAPPSSTSTAR